MEGKYMKIWKMGAGLALCVALAAEGGYAQATNTSPAVRVHVKKVNGQGVKFTSKLAKIVELNFTMGFNHTEGRRTLATTLDRIAQTYSAGGAITVQHITGPGGGASGGVPDFTVNDLLSGQVIVANNVSGFGNTQLGTAKQQAIQRAIEVEGRGYLGIHGSGDNEATGWPWFTNTLHPMNYKGHGDRSVGPVYKHLAESKHVILDGILASRTTNATVPNGVDASGNEVLAQNVPTRGMLNEWYRFGRDISTDATYASKVTVLMKYDPRSLTTGALPNEYKRKGGNMYTYLYRVGTATTSYLPAGHSNDELTDANSGFDGGSGDLEKYMGQLLFYLAGYTETPCDASCNGLPVVDDKDMLTGETWTTSGIANGHFAHELSVDPKVPAFSHPGNVPYEAVLMDIHGRRIALKRGTGPIQYEFDRSGLNTGVYLLKVKAGKNAVQVHRYVLNAPGQ